MSEQQTTVAFFDSTFEEAVDLACEVRDYVADGEKSADAWARLIVSCETLRMTARLTQVIAWFLVQKAVHAGEMSRAEARQEQNRLGGQEVCAAGQELVSEDKPKRLIDLLQRTGGLYERVARLDAMMNA